MGNRGFEKISLEQFNKDLGKFNTNYKEIKIPIRSTKRSAGYDFFSIIDFVLKPGETIKIPTGIKSFMMSDEMLLIIIRSSLGFKFNVRLLNQVGVVDSDYYNNVDNEGHIWVGIKNEGDKEVSINKGDRFCQGIFTKFLISDTEEEINNERTGGIGSTTNKEE